jgi:hypothetical protein
MANSRLQIAKAYIGVCKLANDFLFLQLAFANVLCKLAND